MERYNTTVKHHAWYEHWHRYYFVKELVEDKVVCDIACGEGYGSALLAFEAQSVTGVDIDIETIKHAQQKYSDISNLKYVQSNALDTTFEDDSFDVIVSFETLEHLEEHDKLLNEFTRILKNDGILIISTPDKNVYSSADVDHNKFHVKELSASEFDLLTKEKFKYIKTFGQKLQLTSVIESHIFDTESSINKNTYVEQGKESYPVNNSNEDVYLIKVCSNNKKNLENLDISGINHFSDTDNSLFKHYENQIQKLIEIDKQNYQLRETVEKQKAIINHLKTRLGY
jgi:ubiquinone/menaquinone biosynthesis C-methylase UbiE